MQFNEDFHTDLSKHMMSKEINSNLVVSLDMAMVNPTAEGTLTLNYLQLSDGTEVQEVIDSAYMEFLRSEGRESELENGFIPLALADEDGVIVEGTSWMNPAEVDESMDQEKKSDEMAHPFSVSLSVMRESNNRVTPFVTIENKVLNENRSFIDKERVEFSFGANSMEGLREAIHKTCEFCKLFNQEIPDFTYLYKEEYYSKQIVDKAWEDVSLVLMLD